MTSAELAKAAPGVDWAGCIRGVGVNEDMILVAQPSAFTGEAKLISEAPIAVIRDLLLVRSLDDFSDVLPDAVARSEEHTSELQSLMRISYAVFCLKKKKNQNYTTQRQSTENENTQERSTIR